MSTLSKKLFISVLTLIVTVGAFAATTFAWFTIGTTAQVQTFGAQVQGSTGLEMSFEDSGQWVSTLTTGQLNAYLFDTGYTYVNSVGDDVTILPKLGSAFLLKPVTSANGKDITDITESPLANPVTGGYIEFRLNLRSATGGEVQLTSLSLTGTSYDWKSDANFVLGNGTSVTAGATLEDRTAADAMRVSIQETAGTGSNLFVYENQGIGSNTVLSNDTIDLTLGAHDYFTVKNGVAPVLPTGYVAAETETEVNNNQVAVFPASAEADGYFHAQITIRIWIEGWDYEAYNILFNRPIAVSFNLNKIELP